MGRDVAITPNRQPRDSLPAALAGRCPRDFRGRFFAEDKDHPNDIDGYFECSLDAVRTGELTRHLNRIDPFKVWTRRPYRGYPKKQLPMWHRYRIELYPHIPRLGIGSGIRDKYGHELEFPSAFRQSRRDGKPRGIVKIKYGGGQA